MLLEQCVAEEERKRDKRMKNFESQPEVRINQYTVPEVKRPAWNARFALSFSSLSSPAKKPFAFDNNETSSFLFWWLGRDRVWVGKGGKSQVRQSENENEWERECHHRNRPSQVKTALSLAPKVIESVFAI